MKRFEILGLSFVLCAAAACGETDSLGEGPSKQTSKDGGAGQGPGDGSGGGTGGAAATGQGGADPGDGSGGRAPGGAPGNAGTAQGGSGPTCTLLPCPQVDCAAGFVAALLAGQCCET